MQNSVEVLTIGDELLYGQILNTNSQWISAEAGKIGLRVVRQTAIGDREDEILKALAEAESRAAAVLLTGGLGPTSDDLTKPALAKYFNSPLKISQEALTEVTRFFESRGRKVSELNRRQAELPECCQPISNSLGTAPGMWFEKNNQVFVSMPGVPLEMKRMMAEHILPKLKAHFNPPHIFHKMMLVAGIGESALAEKISDWEKALPPHFRLAYLPGTGDIKLRLTATGDKESLQNEAAGLIEKLKETAGEYIYGYDNETLQSAVGKLLWQRNLTLSVAESCTGGYLSHLITSVPGSSEYFLGSMIPYAYEIKKHQLGIKPETLEQYGAVSEPTIIEMANVVRARFNTHIGVATSGIAGPGGATPEKPVGLVWIAYSDKHFTKTKKLLLTPDRMQNIQLASMAVLNMIRLNIPERG
ncbi:MAG: competence/damage-inducible protein A [Candidatus Nephrothrix sp. EaCA]|nr:MAG: competence/damage-inducible protein A [Candidatus Nephrothrix sp. EaCA]